MRSINLSLSIKEGLDFRAVLEKITETEIPMPKYGKWALAGMVRSRECDPPHLKRAGEKSWLSKKYGLLGEKWKEDITQGFKECMRVLKPKGILVFKWNEEQVSFTEVKRLFPTEPLFGNRRGKTIFVVFMKLEAD